MVVRKKLRFVLLNICRSCLGVGTDRSLAPVQAAEAATGPETADAQAAETAPDTEAATGPETAADPQAAPDLGAATDAQAATNSEAASNAQMGISTGIQGSIATTDVASYTSISTFFPTSEDTIPIQFDDELVYALASIRRIREHAPTVPEVTEVQRKHLSLVDGIALLLVTDDKADVASVSFLQTCTSIDFYYAKNRPCTQKETEYVESLLKIIRDYDKTKRNEYTRRITETAVQMCIRKVCNRIRKISRELARCGVEHSTLKAENLDNLQIWRTTDREGVIGKAFEKAYSRYEHPPDFKRPDKQLLAGYFNFVLEMDMPVKDLLQDFPSLLELLVLSYNVGLKFRTDPIVNNPTIVRRIQKLGDYFGAARSITGTLMDPAIHKLRNAISFTEVKPLKRADHPVRRNFLDIVNSYAISNEQDPIEWKQLTRSFPSLDDDWVGVPEEGEMNVTTSVHCECTIAAHMFRKFPRTHPKVFEIGISKRSCWLCQEYIEFLAQSDNDLTLAPSMRFIVSGYQGKVHSGWRPPPDGPPKAFSGIVGLLKHEMDVILDNVRQKRLSDSFPREADEEDEDAEFEPVVQQFRFRNVRN